MIHKNARTRRMICASGLVLAAAVTACNIQPPPAAASAVLIELSPTARMLAAGDFWSTTGATSKHELDESAIAELGKLADNADRPEVRLRAFKVLCDTRGHSRLNPDHDAAENARAVTLAFEYLEAHLADAEIAKFSPARGFTHMTLSSMDDNTPDRLWVLIENTTVPHGFNGGLNICVDLKTGKVVTVKQWGDIRPK